jgi:23S rRNA (cytidine1920-2'-O)/16S rRNA (cytidine1409-2'-O)-methyltransferase
MARSRPRFIPVLQLVRSVRPDIDDPSRLIAARRLLVDGRFVTNPRALARAGATVTVEPRRKLRGAEKLRFALDSFGVDVRDRICLDVGASAGGFTRILIEHGARRVFAVDAGFGQLRGELRSHARVVNLERTNLADLPRSPVRCHAIDVVTIDLSYVSVAAAVPQLEAVRIAPDADLVALVKPMYELGLATLPRDERLLLAALRVARDGVEAGRCWRVTGSVRSPVPGSRGAREWLLHARRSIRARPASG